MMLVTDSIILHLRRIEDTKEIIRIYKSKKNRQHNGKKKSTKGQRLHMKQKIE